MNVAVIPARGGSKRLPGKNIRSFAGKPMIAHSIRCALQADVFDRVVVSTDDAEIARVAREFGAEVPFTRPPELADDHAGLTDVMAHAIEYFQGEGAALEAVCCIFATAPFLLQQDIRRGLEDLRRGKFQYVFSATSYGYPIFRSFTMNSSGELEMVFPEHFTTRSQDLPPAYHDAAQFCWGRPEAWLNRLRVFDKYSGVVEIPRWRVQDIDTEEDWARAELMAPHIAMDRHANERDASL